MEAAIPDGRPVRVAFSGPATIAVDQDIHARLSQALAMGGALEVDTSGVTDVDLCFLQMLLATRQSVLLNGGTLRLVPPAAGVLRETLRRAGLVGAVPGQPGSDEAFWTGGAA